MRLFYNNLDRICRLKICITEVKKRNLRNCVRFISQAFLTFKNFNFSHENGNFGALYQKGKRYNLFLFVTTSLGLLVGSTVFKPEHNRLEFPYIKRMIVVIIYGRKKVVWETGGS